MSAALLLVGAVPAQAAPDAEGRSGQDEVTYKVIPYVISDPDLVAHPEKVVNELNRSGGSLKALGVAPATKDGPSKLTKPRTEAQVKADPESYVVDSSRFPAGRIPDDIYDYPSSDTCEDQYDLAARDQGWIKNRYSYCQIHLLAMPAVECSIFPPFRCRVTGVFVSRNRLMGFGKVGGAEHVATSRWADFRLQVGVIRATGPFAESGADLTAEIECEGNYLDDDYPQVDDNACFGGLNSEVEKPISEWRRDGSAHLDLLSQASSPDASKGEQIGTGVFHIEYDFDLPWYFQFIDTESPEGGMRFDSAYYLQSHKLGSVFDRAVPGLSYDASDPAVGEVAQHLHDARTNPDATMPTRTGKHFAGATPGDPMHRLAQAKGEAQSSRYAENRRISGNYCRTKEMRDIRDSLPASGGPYECDEYPMASTYEGAGRSTYDGAQYEGHYSVRWVKGTVNGEAGQRLGRWYDVDRILDHDAFHMPITNIAGQ